MRSRRTGGTSEARVPWSARDRCASVARLEFDARSACRSPAHDRAHGFHRSRRQGDAPLFRRRQWRQSGDRIAGDPRALGVARSGRGAGRRARSWASRPGRGSIAGRHVGAPGLRGRRGSHDARSVGCVSTALPWRIERRVPGDRLAHANHRRQRAGGQARAHHLCRATHRDARRSSAARPSARDLGLALTMPISNDPRPIGVFDSGIGGLTAVRQMFRLLPSEAVIYFGDTARLPYGSKSRETVTRFSLEISSFLVRQNIKALLVACNTASSFALPTLIERLDIPVVGVIEPAARAAVTKSPHGRIGVIGTLGTVASGAYPAAIERLAPDAAVISRACPLFVPLVEEGWIDHAVTRAIAEEYLLELRNGRLESLILGCTHYPLLAPLIANLVGSDVTLVDSGAEAARVMADLLRERGQL